MTYYDRSTGRAGTLGRGGVSGPMIVLAFAAFLFIAHTVVFVATS